MDRVGRCGLDSWARRRKCFVRVLGFPELCLSSPCALTHRPCTWDVRARVRAPTTSTPGWGRHTVAFDERWSDGPAGGHVVDVVDLGDAIHEDPPGLGRHFVEIGTHGRQGRDEERGL